MFDNACVRFALNFNFKLFDGLSYVDGYESFYCILNGRILNLVCELFQLFSVSENIDNKSGHHQFDGF